MISAVVLTKNEERNLERCLGSLSWCEEIIIVDDFSSDKTVEIAKKFKAVVIQRKLDADFSGQRNFGLKRAKNEWVFFVDADEVVLPDLAQEISSHLKSVSLSVVGFKINRRDFFGGKWLKYGESGDSRPLRLARKNAGSWKGKVHEIWSIDGEVENLKNYLEHYPHQTIGEFLEDVNFYSSLRSQELFEAKQPAGIFEIIIYPLGKFFENYFIRLGFLDGEPGIIYALMMSLHSFLVRAKLYQLWRT